MLTTKVEDWGEYVVGGTSFRHFSSHPKPRLEKSIGESVWVVSGELVGSRRKYTLCSVFTPSVIEDNDDPFVVVGDGFGWVRSAQCARKAAFFRT